MPLGLVLGFVLGLVPVTNATVELDPVSAGFELC